MTAGMTPHNKPLSLFISVLVIHRTFVYILAHLLEKTCSPAKDHKQNLNEPRIPFPLPLACLHDVHVQTHDLDSDARSKPGWETATDTLGLHLRLEKGLIIPSGLHRAREKALEI